jgi:hypothetical protein
VDLTEQVLADTSYVFLLVSPFLEQADDSRLDLINELYEYAHEHSYAFYCLTSSTHQNIDRWREMTGAEYPFCTTDGITLKTVIRSNPGVVLLKNGTIIRKWSHNNLPEFNESQSVLPLEKLPEGHLPTTTAAEKIAALLMWFVLPLTLLSLADRTWMWTRWLRRRKKNVNENVNDNNKENEQQNTNVKACNLSEIECFILDSAINQGLEKEQAYKILAISKHETGNWTSKIFIERHNFGGIIRNGKFESYENNEQGIKDMIHVLKDYYFARGKNTLEDIQKSYCPIGASNDPTGLNNYWLPRVTQYYNEYLNSEKQ